MSSKRVDELDLNLLPYFNELMKERKVSKVAEALGVSQPAVSNALKRLRGALGDDLFLRTTHGMEPTTLARQLAEPVAYAMDTIRAAMSQQVEFDPAVADRRFSIGLSDLGEMYFLPPLLDRIMQQAPNVSITTIRNNPATLKEDMEHGRVDVFVGVSPQLQGSFFRQRLYREHYVCAFRKEHPFERKAMSLSDYTSYDHVVVAAGHDHSEVDKLIERKGVERRIRLTVPHLNAAGYILQSTDLLATVPSKMCRIISEQFGLRHCPHPVAIPEISVGIFWHAAVHRDPANQWLRRMIFELFSEIPQPGA
jgi:DNA-binding transcriptional LysR family regulator